MKTDQMSVPGIRIRSINRSPINPNGRFVLYWMIAARRRYYNFSLQRAVELATRLNRPLVILEALRCDYPWASDRLHAFILQGMQNNRTIFRNTPVLYYPYVEPEPGAGKGLLRSLSVEACAVVTDEYPCFFLPRMVQAASGILSVRLETVDANGLFPLRAPDRLFTRAFSFRRWMQKHLLDHVFCMPDPDPLKNICLPEPKPLPAEIVRRWAPPDPDIGLASEDFLQTLPIHHGIPPTDLPGGTQAAAERLEQFLGTLESYHLTRNHPDLDSTSRLSPYLHFGFISSHEILKKIMDQESWDPGRLSSQVTGKASGFWGMTEGAEAFLEELVIWRELGFNHCFFQNDEYRFSLPGWARNTLLRHAGDIRTHQYTREEFEGAHTHDDLWNAAQTQLLCEGRIHNYLRMLWGKKILEWSDSPETALSIMIELNNRYALDGRDPNSYSGIFWVLGRYDRAWGPERPVVGTIRYMSSERTRQKVKTREYLKRYGQQTIPGSGGAGATQDY